MWSGLLPGRKTVLAVVTLAATVAISSRGTATLIPGSKNPRNDCLIEADVDAVAGPGPGSPAWTATTVTTTISVRTVPAVSVSVPA
jgi:hypothetical protein